MPSISVIIPVYNVEKYIHRCVDSILRQSYTDFELILVDDGSPDNCGTICDEYAQKDSRIRVIHQKNAGLSAARNAGIDWVFANSNSQWLTFIDSDDWIHPHYLHTLLHAATSTNLPLSICGIVRTTGEVPTILDHQFTPTLWDAEEFFIEHHVNAIVACGKLYKKETFRNIRYPAGKIHEDEFTTHKLLFATNKIVVVEAPMYYYYQNNSGITGASWTPKRLDVLAALSKRVDFLKAKKLDKAYLWQIFDLISCTTWQKKTLDTMGNNIAHRYSRYLRKYLRKALRHGRRTHSVPFRGNEYLYGLAYPLSIRLYSYMQSIQKRVYKKK